MNQCNRTAFDKEMNKLYCNISCPGSCNQIKENYSEPPSGSYSQTISLGEGDEIDRKVCRPGSERLWDNKKIITCTREGQRIRVNCNNGFERNDNGFRCKEKVKAPLKTVTYSLNPGDNSKTFCAPDSEKLRVGQTEIECMSSNRDKRVLLGCNSKNGGIFVGDHTNGFSCVDINSFLVHRLLSQCSTPFINNIANTSRRNPEKLCLPGGAIWDGLVARGDVPGLPDE